MRRYALIRAARRHSAAPRAGWLPITLLLTLRGAGCDLNVTGGPPSRTSPSLYRSAMERGPGVRTITHPPQPPDGS